MALFTTGFGPNPTNTIATLKQLEEYIEGVRAMGAPDDANVIRTAPGSVKFFEIQWIGEPE